MKGQLVLLYVMKSDGSSPGRQGFKMLVAADGWMDGSIGGGFMEHKLVELSKSMLEKGTFKPLIKKQIHRTNESKDRSGMICSGEQIVSFYYLDKSSLKVFLEVKSRLDSGQYPVIKLDENGISLLEESQQKAQFDFKYTSPSIWSMIENTGFKPLIYIIGAGHVGLAMSKLMYQLDFRVIIFDDREELNTLEQNVYAEQKNVVDYNLIGDYIDDDEESYITVMTFGYRTDKLVMTELLDKKCKYFVSKG